jgi:putative hydrolase of the HAD superfamily
LRVSSKEITAIEIKTFIEKYVPINQACWKLYQYDKISHEEALQQVEAFF